MRAVVLREMPKARRPAATRVGARAKTTTGAVHLLGDLYVVSGEKLTHPWDANGYLIGGSEPTLIDCGSTAGYPALRRNLARLGYKPADIRRVIVTHGHWDHASGMAALRKESGAELLIHSADRKAVETGDDDRTSAFLYGQRFPKLKVDGTLRHGQTIHAGGCDLRVLHTPGHTPGSICVATEIGGVRLLIAGDTLWGGFHPRIGSDLEDWKRSLDRLLEQRIDALTVGHSTPNLHFDALLRIEEARAQLGTYFNPWFKPFDRSFRY
jgi:glyoxylase-like metal-dependent hydrolase (beta-lactamase superfamily II)